MAAPRKRRGPVPAAAMPPDSGMREVQFTRRHQHAGAWYQVGDRLLVDERTREKLLRFGAIAEA